jgi:molecular chaperone HtpG
MSLETRKFDAEVGKVLNLMIHSLYTNKEIFMRELISNASDACDKLRYLAISNPELIKDDPNFKITVKVNKDARELVISDNGIGMNKEDLIENLGTIAKSGTQAFMQQITGDAKKDTSLIGQFGVGFYSVYMIADMVKVISRKAGDEKAYLWSSDGLGEYNLEDAEKAVRGTEITIHIKQGDDDYLDHFRLKHIIKTYSDHISIPIFFEHNGVENQVNSSSAIWARPKSDVSKEQYQEFYKSVAYAADEPWLILHNKNEGAIDFTNLLFIPTNKTFDLFHPDRRRRVKLYIKKVFITDENIDLVPRYMRFLRGVVDCDSLPLNISRETLQHNSTIDKIRASIVNRVISELKKQKDNDRAEYQKFWDSFGSAIKEGLCEAIPEAEKLLDICIFQSVLQNKMVTLDEYIQNFAEGQKEIYYISGDNIEKLKSSPQIEGFKKKNIDVLLFTDTVDDFWVNIINKYKDFDIRSVTRSDIDLKKYDNSTNKEEDKQKTDENYAGLISHFKTVLGDLVKDVKISKKLESIPACLAVDDGAMDIRMERFLIEQKQLNSASAKILEINPDHNIMTKIIQDVQNNNVNEDTTDLTKLIYDQACVIENEPLTDPAEFCRRLNKFIHLG